MLDNLPIAEFQEGDGFKFIKSIPNWLFPIKVDNSFEVDYSDFYDWVEGRVMPEARIDIKKELKEMGLSYYHSMDIAKVTKAALMGDPYWVAFTEADEKNWRVSSVRGAAGYPEIKIIDLWKN